MLIGSYLVSQSQLLAMHYDVLESFESSLQATGLSQLKQACTRPRMHIQMQAREHTHSQLPIHNHIATIWYQVFFLLPITYFQCNLHSVREHILCSSYGGGSHLPLSYGFHLAHEGETQVHARWTIHTLFQSLVYGCALHSAINHVITVL